MPVQLPHVTHTPLVHWLSLVHQHWSLLCSTPVAQVSLVVWVETVSVVSATQLWLSTVEAVLPVHEGLAQVAVPSTVVGTQAPVEHWLLFVHRHSVFAAFGVPTVQVPRLGLHAVTQPSEPPAPAVPVHDPFEQPALLLSHEPLLHWLSLLQMHLLVLELYVPTVQPWVVEGVHDVLARVVQSKSSVPPLPVQTLPEH